MPANRSHLCELRLLHLGRPPALDRLGISEDMCVAVEPASSSSRGPLSPNKPLPWRDCHHSSFMVTTVRIKNKLFDLDNSQRTVLSFDERETHLDHMSKDNQRRMDALGLVSRFERDSPIASSPLVEVRALDLQSIPGFSNPVHLFEEVVALQK